MDEEEIPKIIGHLNKPIGPIKGYETAQIGHEVVEHNDRYSIVLKSETENKLRIVDYYKATLKPFINFLK